MVNCLISFSGILLEVFMYLVFMKNLSNSSMKIIGNVAKIPRSIIKIMRTLNLKSNVPKKQSYGCFTNED